MTKPGPGVYRGFSGERNLEMRPNGVKMRIAFHSLVAGGRVCCYIMTNYPSLDRLQIHSDGKSRSTNFTATTPILLLCIVNSEHATE
jgi:hypothetical protein